ncbi:translation initiation factor IF-1 [Candidatus Gromoviella agglomerans]|uniref:translation initiation factor IF-1 n=1 Tax=Candidatus Gromoviella agglomerans TaxID=2806609 RepID=UPI001E419CA5|nr:translation initiation factor IF-1 [Candidatus Gromoviella agglomerans]UFX98420.1 Translation initiation factor IF-1 [Candidatus Gromoviella agglomerans]
MSKDIVEKMGIVKDILPNAEFRVMLTDENRIINAYLSGKIRQNHIRVQEGDVVKVEVSLYDTTRGRIVFREKKFPLH